MLILLITPIISPPLTWAGAPEIILEKCDAILIKGRPTPLNDIYKRGYEDAYKEVAAQGERVIGT